MSLTVAWDGRPVGRLDQPSERSREYEFTYTDPTRALSLSLPVTRLTSTSAQSRPFFEALLPEGAVREQVAAQLKLVASDSYGLLAELGRDCAGAIQIFESPESPGVRWLDAAELDELIENLPTRPLRLRFSLAGERRKAALVRDSGGHYGEPLNGRPTTHILKPDLPGEAIAVNEFFCMSLARRCGLDAAHVELATFAGRPCVVVTRFDRDVAAVPVRRLHQEDLCQALGLTTDFKYQRPGWEVPSFAALARVLDEHGARPGADRLAVAEGALFNFLVGNADAHAKNVSLLHTAGRVRLAPLYDVVCTAAYPDLRQELALGIGDEFDPAAVGMAAWDDFAFDLELNRTAFQRRRSQLAARVRDEAAQLRDEARRDGWHDPVIDSVMAVVAARCERI